MKYLVTGAAGFIGSNIAFALIKERKASVIGLDDFSSGHFKNLIGFNGDVIAADIRETSWWEKVGRVDAVFHQAAITDTTVTDQKKMMEINVEAFKNVLAYAVKYDIRTIIYASSAATYGRGECPMKEDQRLAPENVYGFSKAMMDNVARDFWEKNPKFKVVGLRYFNVYGPKEGYKGKFASMIYQLYLQMKTGHNPRIFKYGQQSRDFVYIKDIVRINLNALDAEKSCIVNAGTGKAETFNYVIDCLNKVMKTKFLPEYFDNPYDFFQDRTQADLRKARCLLNYSPVWNLQDGIADYIRNLEGK